QFVEAFDFNKWLASRTKRLPNGCLEWIEKIDSYPEIRIEGSRWHVHRALWVFHRGPVPANLYIRHRVCDNHLCCEITHLDVGTQQDNMNDTLLTGRGPKGERNVNAKLTEALVRTIRSANLSIPQLAEKYGVSTNTIGAILRNETWTHLTPTDKRRDYRRRLK